MTTTRKISKTANFHRRDQYHQEASDLFRRLRGERARLVMTDLILAEVHLHLVRGLGPRRAASHLATLKSDPQVDEVFTTPDLQAAALADWMRRFADHAFTFTDAVSFATMRAERIGDAFTFDRHFTVAGFNALPSAARTSAA